MSENETKMTGSRSWVIAAVVIVFIVAIVASTMAGGGSSASGGHTMPDGSQMTGTMGSDGR